jgi:hypothetical protein
VVTVVKIVDFVVVPVAGTAVFTGAGVGTVVATVVAAAVVCWDVTIGVGVGVEVGVGCGEPEKNPLRRMYTTTRAMTAKAIIPIFFKRRRCFFFRTISLYRAGR